MWSSFLLSETHFKGTNEGQKYPWPLYTSEYNKDIALSEIFSTYTGTRQYFPIQSNIPIFICELVSHQIIDLKH